MFATLVNYNKTLTTFWLANNQLMQCGDVTQKRSMAILLETLHNTLNNTKESSMTVFLEMPAV